MELGNPMRVLYIDAGISLAGGQYGLIQLLRNLDGGQVEPVVASPPGSGIEVFCKGAGIVCLPLPFSSIHLAEEGGDPRLSSRVLGALRGVGMLMRAARSHGIDIFHANTFRAGLVSGLAARLLRKPMIYQDRTLLGHVPVGHLLWSLATRIVVISKAVRAKYPGVYSNKIRLVPDMVDIDRFQPGQAPSVPEGEAVGYLGRISPEKGLIHLVMAAPMVMERFPRARFVVGGVPFTEQGKRYLGTVHREIERLGLSDAFEFVGRVDDAPAFLRRLSVLALPSESEGSGTVVLEAMAVAKPVVAFNTGGQREIIGDGEDGYLVAGLSSEGLAEGIIRILGDPVAAAWMGARGREKVAAGYSSSAVTARMLEVYAEVAG